MPWPQPSPLRSLLALWHVVDPRDSFHASIVAARDQVPNVLGLCVLEAVIISLLARRSDSSTARYLLGDAMASLACGLVEEVFGRLAGDSFPTPHAWIRMPLFLKGLWKAAGLLLTYLAATIVSEFCFYWFHRCSHEISLLWMLHQVHHNGQDMNLSTSARRHFLTPYVANLFFLPMALVGFPLPVIILHSVLNSVSQVWIHTRLIPKLHPAIEYVLNTPSHHRVHHGRNPYCLDKNYGGFLIIFDRLFGTFAEERDSEPVLYGTIIPLRSVNPVVAQAAPIVAMVRRVRDAPWQHKIRAVVYGPGWTVSKPNLRLGDPADVPSVPNLIETPSALESERHDVPLHGAIRSYLVLNMVILFAWYFLIDGGHVRPFGLKEGPTAGYFCWFAFLLMSVGSMGLLWDGHLNWGWLTEMLRWSLALLVVTWFGISTTPVTIVTLCAGILSLAFCLANLFDVGGIRKWSYRAVATKSVDEETVEMADSSGQLKEQ